MINSQSAVKDYDTVVNRFLSIEIHELFEELINIKSGKESRNITTCNFSSINNVVHILFSYEYFVHIPFRLVIHTWGKPTAMRPSHPI